MSILSSCVKSEIDVEMMGERSFDITKFLITADTNYSSLDVNLRWQKVDSIDGYDVRINRNGEILAEFYGVTSNNLVSSLSESKYEIYVWAIRGGKRYPAFNNGLSITVDLGLALTATVKKRESQKRYAGTLPIEFDLNFNKTIDPSTLDTSDIVQLGDATGVSWIITNTGNDRNYILTATAASTGSLIPEVSPSSVSDLLSKTNSYEGDLDSTVFYDNRAAKPRRVKFIRVDPTTIRMEWTRGDPLNTGFVLAWATTEGGADCAVPNAVKGAFDYYHDITGLTPNQEYFVKICSENVASRLSEPVLRSGKTLPNCDVTVSVNPASDQARLQISAARTPGGAAPLLITANNPGYDGNNLRIRIDDGGASGTASATAVAAGIPGVTNIVITAYDDSSSNDDLIAAIAADGTVNSLITASGSDATDGVDPTMDFEWLSLGYGFSQFQTILDISEVNRATHIADDGLVTVCLESGIRIVDSDARAYDNISIPGDDFFIYGTFGEGKQFFNYSTISGENGIFEVSGIQNFSLANIEAMIADGRHGKHIAINTNSNVNVLTNLLFNRVGTDSASNSNPFIIYDTSIEEVSNIVYKTANWHADGILLNNSTVEKMINVTDIGTSANSASLELAGSSYIINLHDFTTDIGKSGSGTSYRGLYVHDDSYITNIDNLVIYQNIYGRGIVLGDNGFINKLDNLFMRRIVTTNINTYGIETDSSATGAYINSGQVSKVRMCNSDGLSVQMEEIDGGILRETDGTSATVFNPYPSGTGISTFPFTDLSGVGEQGMSHHISLGGLCEVHKVSGLMNSAITTNSISLSWTPSSQGSQTGYRIAYYENRSDTYGSASSVVGNCMSGYQIPEGSFIGNSATISGLKANTKYDFAVCAVNENLKPVGYSEPRFISVTTDP